MTREDVIRGLIGAILVLLVGGSLFLSLIGLLALILFQK